MHPLATQTHFLTLPASCLLPAFTQGTDMCDLICDYGFSVETVRSWNRARVAQVMYNSKHGLDIDTPLPIPDLDAIPDGDLPA